MHVNLTHYEDDLAKIKHTLFILLNNLYAMKH